MKLAVDIIFCMNRQDFPILSSDHKVLIGCCQKEIDTASVLELLSTYSGQDYLRIHTLANKHGVYPLLYRTLKSITPATFSAATEELFKQSNMAIAQYNMLMSAELLQLMHLFSENGMEAMAFKGPVLAEIAYGSATFRQYGDLDILIKKENIHETLSLLHKRGYTPEIALESSTLETFYKCVNVIGLHKGAVRVEIHWELLSKNYAIEWDEEKLWRDTETVEVNRRPIKMLSFENHLLYLCAHGSKHLFERLEWVCDIDRLVRCQSKIDWDKLLIDAQAMGIERMLFLGLTLANVLFDLPLAQQIAKKADNSPIIKELIEKIIDSHYRDEISAGKSYGSFGLLWQMRENLGDRLRFAYRALFAPKFDDFKFVVLPKKALFLYPLIRPIRLLVKYFHR